MSIQNLAKQFVDMCNQGKNFDVMKTMYADDIVSVEASGAETAGKAAVIKKSEIWASGLTINSEKVRGPFFNSANGSNGQFAVHYTFEVTPNDTGKKITLEEVGVYTVFNDKITREQFFYEGKW